MKNYINRLRFIIKYLYYILFSRHKKGFGIHSPFVYNLIIKVFNSSEIDDEFRKIEETRKLMLQSKSKVNLTKKGAGSLFYKNKNIKLSNIVKNSAVPRKYGKLLFNIISYFNIDTVVELGTSTGISTLYMAAVSNNVKIFTIEGENELAEIAKNNFALHDKKNIDIIVGDFDDSFTKILRNDEKKVLVFIDGNHKKEATINYFTQLIEKHNKNTIIIVDDIYWNKEMGEAWKSIKENEMVSVTIDIFRMGIVFFINGITKQNFRIKY